MNNRVIKMSLTTTSITNAISEINRYKAWLERCTKDFIKALGDVGVEIASVKFSQAVYDGVNDVAVTVESKEGYKVSVQANGGAVLFIEFGTGVRYPDNHPEAAANGMIRGAYGHRLGRLEKGWRYTGSPGTNGEIITEGKHAGEIHTYGNPANRSMYDTERELILQFEDIARRIYT